MLGPPFDLVELWNEHLYFEFDARSVEHTMNTMVLRAVRESHSDGMQDAAPESSCALTISQLAGGIGRNDLTAFYREHFIFSNPQDAKLELLSQTIGVDRVAEEFNFKCTHDRMVDWL
jgi:carboxymethylenebutenolidase